MPTWIREPFKHVAVCLPHSYLFDACNYAVGNSPELRQRPPRVLSRVDKSVYFATVSEQIPSDLPLLFLEFGVWRGASLRHWTTLNTNPDSLFFGFDSFEGIPKQWRRRPPGYFSTDGELPAIDDSRVQFIKGWFNRSLPGFLSDTFADVSRGRRLVVHIDSDLYHSCLYLLTRLHDECSPEYFLLLDNYSAGEARALRDYMLSYNARFEPMLARQRQRVSGMYGQVFGVVRTDDAGNAGVVTRE